MTKPSSIAERVTKLEEQLPEVARKADDAIFLARKADTDVADFRLELHAHKKVLQALRQNQLEMQTEMREGFGMLATGQRRIVELLTVAQRQARTTNLELARRRVSIRNELSR